MKNRNNQRQLADRKSAKISCGSLQWRKASAGNSEMAVALSWQPQ
jgi:hypothetical protein